MPMGSQLTKHKGDTDGGASFWAPDLQDTCVNGVESKIANPMTSTLLFAPA